MKFIQNKAFTLVELLVVITILAIISVVAYQNFGGAVDKAVSGRKISDVSTIESSLAQYKVDKNYYPATDISSSSNLWGYNSGSLAQTSNTLVVTKTGESIDAITAANTIGGWRIMWLNDGTNDWSTKQIWAKGTISQSTLWKRYLTKDLFDPELWDIKVSTDTMIDSWVGRYVYATFKKPLSADTNWTSNKQATYYNIAYTVKVDGWDKYITKIVGDYDSESCFEEKTLCPDTLIGPWSSVLVNNQEHASSDTSSSTQWIPYPVDWY